MAATGNIDTTTAFVSAFADYINSQESDSGIDGTGRLGEDNTTLNSSPETNRKSFFFGSRTVTEKQSQDEKRLVTKLKDALEHKAKSENGSSAQGILEDNNHFTKTKKITLKESKNFLVAAHILHSSPTGKLTTKATATEATATEATATHDRKVTSTQVAIETSEAAIDNYTTPPIEFRATTPLDRFRARIIKVDPDDPKKITYNNDYTLQKAQKKLEEWLTNRGVKKENIIKLTGRYSISTGGEKTIQNKLDRLKTEPNEKPHDWLAQAFIERFETAISANSISSDLFKDNKVPDPIAKP